MSQRVPKSLHYYSSWSWPIHILCCCIIFAGEAASLNGRTFLNLLTDVTRNKNNIFSS